MHVCSSNFFLKLWILAPIIWRFYNFFWTLNGIFQKWEVYAWWNGKIWSISLGQFMKQRPLISEYIVLIVGLWKKNIGAAHFIGIQECKFFKFPTKFCVVTSDFISDSSIPVNAERHLKLRVSVLSRTQFVGSEFWDFLEGSNEFFCIVVRFW